MATPNKRAPSAHESGGEMAMFGPHIVALIDFLGQSSELAKWDFIPNTVTETAVWVPAVRSTIGRVLMWREEFERRFTEYQKSLDAYEQSFSTAALPEKLKQFNEFRQTTLHHQHFSDTLIFYSPLQNEHGYWQISNVVGFLVVCGTLFLGSLTTSTPLRGAIEVGMLSRFPTGDPYGPGLAKAHYLESKVADYPRIVVGPTLLSYLDWLQNHSDRDAPAQANRVVAAQCRDHITKDADGQWIVDYLSDTFANAGGNPTGWHQMQREAFAFVTAEQARFAAGTDTGSQKLARRYTRMVDYFRSRGSA